MYFSDNEWFLINNIILEIHRASSHKTMRETFLKKIRYIISYDKANFFLASDSEEHLIEDSVAVGFPDNYLSEYFGNLEKYDFTNWIYAAALNEVFLLSDLLSADERQRDTYYQNYFIPNDIEHAIIVSLAYNKKHVGTLSLFRSAPSENFWQHDVQVLNLLKDHLSLFLYRNVFERSEKDSREQNLRTLSEKYQLTAREAEIFLHLIRGETFSDIAETLFISEGTLRKHTSNIYRKCGISNRNEINQLLFSEE